MTNRPDWTLEDAAIAAGSQLVCGVDEVGRGPLAGPVTAAAVLLPRPLPPALADQINDSKRIPKSRHAALAEAITTHANCHIAHATVAEIETLNIRKAAHLAMCRAVAGLAEQMGGLDLVLVDGHEVPDDLGFRGRAVVKGDSVSLSIAAASLVAKAARDQIMVDFAQQYPGYGWERNAGYGTAEHRTALQKLGVTPIHRRSFGTVHKILYQDISAKP